MDFKSEESYIQNLQKEYGFLKTKYDLEPIDRSIFKFFRLRPVSFPTVRMMQLASLFVHYQNLFAFLMGTGDLKRLSAVFRDLSYPEFWQNHFTMEKESSVESEKKISEELIERMIINVVLPIKYVYFKQRGKDLSDEIIEAFRNLPPEKNTTIQGFSDLGLKAENSFESQAYLELKKHFCNEKKCLNCALGLQLLKHV